MATNRPRLLVKTKRLPKGTSFAVNKVPFAAAPLFAAKKAESVWHVAEAPEDVSDAALWDLCHELRTRGMGLAGGADVEFAEPDLEQKWTFDTQDRLAGKGFRAAAGAEACEKPDPPDPRFPRPDPFNWNWFQDAAHSGLGAARDLIKDPADRVTIAHLDTGYRKGHAILPPHLDLAAQRSFVEKDPDPNDASDPFVSGIGTNAGHGMGTLGILAGNKFDGTFVGGAPFARVVPIRVANGVVLFTNSSIARGLEYAIACGADVVSMSMGGVASQLWADMVNQAYMEGVTLVTAAGNNFGPGKLRVPRFIVYPARFGRVIAACGVMADGKPYADFKDPRLMGGSYGPASKMATAMAAYTPNTPWAKYVCPALVDFDGAGTSSATPQIAAAAACWLQKNRAAVKKYSKKWMRVEAVRRALFGTANGTDSEHFGHGTLRALAAMGEKPAAEAELKMQAADGVDVPFLGPVWQVLFGLSQYGVSERMLRIEAAQVLGRSGELQNLLLDLGVDPDAAGADVSAESRQRFVEAMREQQGVSSALRAALGGGRRGRVSMAGAGPRRPLAAENPEPPAPLTRKLRVFAFDPLLGLRLDTERINQTTLHVRWEPELEPGPVGEYLEVVDVDPSSGVCYAPVDLAHPHLLASDGLSPAEGVPQFHQQMVYAVAMTTIQRFEDALGRTALWAPRRVTDTAGIRDQYVQRLRIYPHALREANAYYSPDKNALLFGYFQANTKDVGDNLPGGLVFNCLSHDVVAHETAHALVDGLHRYYRNETNPDIGAFHEAMADIVAMFQHFTIPAALRHAIAKSRGDLRKNNLLADLAQQFGQASSGTRALRSALGRKPTQNDYQEATEAHDRGAVLLGAVFEAFLEIYEARIEDLKRIATGGTGVLPPGDIPVELVNRMAEEASEIAARVLTTCIRALDYCPPVDLTFGEYLRALITADMDLEPEHSLNYRTAFISGFRARGIFPNGVRNLSEENLRWSPPQFVLDPDGIQAMVGELDLAWDLSSNRRDAYIRGEKNGAILWDWLQRLDDASAVQLQRDLGIYIHAVEGMPAGVKLNNAGKPVVQIHSVRPARRINSRNQQMTDLVVEAVQQCQAQDPETKEWTTHRGGCTILIDLKNYRIRYAIRKRVGHPARVAEERAFRRMAAEGQQGYFDNRQSAEPFALLHRGA
ncbi:MAG: S8 family serine peptidase [Bryobacterales bacterium]|nr:S8 family serine peptidase [Bryobacterales bacterium]